MARNNSTKRALQPLKDQIASQLNVNLSNGPNLTTAQAGHVGGQMVKQMINSYENSMTSGTNTGMQG
jgi:hypothetical protein